MLLFLCLKVCSGGYSHRDICSLQCYTRLSSSAAWTKALVGGKASVRSTNIALFVAKRLFSFAATSSVYMKMFMQCNLTVIYQNSS